MEAKVLTLDYISSKLDELPTLPTIVYELSRVINDPMSSTNDIEKIMAHDQSLTARVLKLVNSAYYAIPGGVSSLSRAIAYIGFDTVNQLVLSASIINALKVSGPTAFDLNQFWKHSIGVAIATETIAKSVRHPNPTDLFTAGLVHDMGKVALYTFDPDAVAKILHLTTQKQISYLEAETELDFPKHTHIGHQLAQKWNLPPFIAATIRHHHTKDAAQRAGLTADINRGIDIVLLANLLTNALKFGNSGHSKVLGAPTDVLERLTVDPDQGLKTLIQDIKAAQEKATEFLRVLGGVA